MSATPVPAEARARFRAGLRVPTPGWAPGFAQANLIVVPGEYAYETLLFGQRNPKPCPITGYWTADLVAFLIGCSFTLEAPMLAAGIEIRHLTMGGNVSMYTTNRPCRPAGRLRGPMVVSMRPIAADRVADAVRISGRFPAVHGAPVQVGEPAALGIEDLSTPDSRVTRGLTRRARP